MADKNKTIYQAINNLLISDQFGDVNANTNLTNSFPQQSPTTLNTASGNKKIIIRGTSKEEIERKALELQQREELKNKFFKTADRGFQKAMQYEAARLPAYLDYEGMEYYPLIASALDLIMEESTTIGHNGKMLNIYSEKERIKIHLEELFYDVLNVNVNLPFWTRNLIKYGDNFVMLNTEKNKGITAVRQMVNYEMERYERIVNGKMSIKFKQRQTGDDFNIFEIAHFRLLGDDKYMPYGSSILNKIRRVFRQLILAEDAMLTYRIIRAGEKRVFKIDVGNIDEDDIEQYIHKIATRFKKQQQVYPDSGQIDYRFNILGNDEDYFVPVRNSNVQTGVDVLTGAQNLDQIQDIEYLRDNLFTGLGIPKPFLGYQSTAGEGKNLAQMDVRFQKKINRVQQALIQELNKIAIIHLYFLGFSADELGKFTLSLTNPSTQQEILKAELWQQKAQVYTELTRNEGGIAAMSHTEAKRLLFNMSDAEIVDDFKKQRMERALAQELQDSPLLIKKTGIFNDIDAKYADPDAVAMLTGNTMMANAEGGSPLEGLPELPTGGEGGGGGGNFQSPESLPSVIGQGKGFKEKNNVLSENRFNDILNELVKTDNNKKDIDVSKIIIKENNSKNQYLNETAKKMVDEIDNLLKENNQNIDDIESI